MLVLMLMLMLLSSLYTCLHSCLVLCASLGQDTRPLPTWVGLQHARLLVLADRVHDALGTIVFAFLPARSLLPSKPAALPVGVTPALALVCFRSIAVERAVDNNNAPVRFGPSCNLGSWLPVYCFVALWERRRRLESSSGHPCLCSRV